MSAAIADKIEIRYLLGGLAAESDRPMPADMQSQIKSNWQKIQQTIPGIEFNYDFWRKCKPRRSTYPACRAVIAARKQHQEKAMITAIQHAYYLQAKNPSDYDVLYKLAHAIQLNTATFTRDLNSDETHNQLTQEIQLSRLMGVESLPSLFIEQKDRYFPIVLDYNNIDIMIEHINSFI